MTTTTLNRVILEMGPDGRSRFREEAVPVAEFKPMLFLTEKFPGGDVVWRVSPPGYSMDFHMTTSPQWTFVVKGQLEIGLQDGTCRVFGPGDVLFSHDILRPGESFDPKIHGHNSRQLGDEPLVTILVRN